MLRLIIAGPTGNANKKIHAIETERARRRDESARRLLLFTVCVVAFGYSIPSAKP